MQFSVIIPVYNGAKVLGRCLDSILVQTYEDYQVVIVDDGSTDRSLSVARAYAASDDRFTVLPSCHGGPGAARNKGLAAAQGEYVVYMDADDCWTHRDLLQTLHDFIAAQPADVYMYQMTKVT